MLKPVIQTSQTITSSLLALFCLLVSCNHSNNGNDVSTYKTAKDSALDISKKYSINLVDLKERKKMEVLLCQAWQLEDDMETLSMSSQPMGMLPFRSFYLSADSSFIMNPRNDIEYGRWAFDATAKTITLLPVKGNTIIYKIGALSYSELVVSNGSNGGNSNLKFISSGKRYANTNDDPYHISNNRWRIAPKKPENEKEIRQRLKGFVHFHILFYRDNIAREEKAISFYGFPTCLKWYAGGIFIIKETEIAENWLSCFYNREQALKARAMMEEVIGKKYKWPKSGISWVMKNLDVLEQMYQQL